MATWEHSHNLRETTRERLESVVRELQVELERGRSAARMAPEDERKDLQRLDKAVALLQQALETLAG